MAYKRVIIKQFRLPEVLQVIEESQLPEQSLGKPESSKGFIGPGRPGRRPGLPNQKMRERING
jgi:hypothetical protein